jgi:endonuclease/exonuclease/phosphatase family metal-dependent hydrolase
MKTQKTGSKREIKLWRALFGAPSPKLVALRFGLVAALVLVLPAQAGQPFGPGGERGVDVMQANLYIGADLHPIVMLDPTDPDYLTKLVGAVTTVYYQIVASQPAVRLGGVADAIAARMPDIVTVEEATLLRNQSPGDLVLGGTTPATNVVFDYVQILVDSLAVRGLHYAVVSSADEWDVEMPMFNVQTGGIDDVRQTDREAILVRTDLPPGQFRAANPQNGHFANAIVFPSIGLSFTRGWCSADVSIRGRNFRCICAHLEEETAPQIQALQAQELLNGPVNTSLPVMILGDFNTDPFGRDGSFAYGLFPAAGFSDAWAVVHPENPTGGLTWGHDALLANPAVAFDRRIDFVLYKGTGFVPTQADVVDLRLDRTEPPLWSSDHASLSADFLLQ